ncbi:hypothetical protein [Natrinema marinum]|uniref:hypothetical protein n=1 Tax=Natrinema marinum TaxID=2961598 RepID=UPI0020C92714|nr:hypothetical protein [Natrinema marinum]
MRISRRQTVASLASITGFSVIPAGATQNDPTPAAREIGIDKRVQELLRNGKEEVAHSLLEKHSINYASTSDVYKSAFEGYHGKGGVSTSDVWIRDEARATFTAWNVSDNLYHATLAWTLDGRSNDVDAAIPWDGAMIGWEDSTWSFEPDSPTLIVLNEFGDGTTNSATASIQNRPLFDAPTNAIGARVGDGEADSVTRGDTKMRGSLEVELTKERNSEATIGGKYTHTWTFGLGQNGVSFTGAKNGIGIGLTLPLGRNDKWTIPKDPSDRYIKL